MEVGSEQIQPNPSAPRLRSGEERDNKRIYNWIDPTSGKNCSEESKAGCREELVWGEMVFGWRHRWSEDGDTEGENFLGGGTLSGRP